MELSGRGIGTCLIGTPSVADHAHCRHKTKFSPFFGQLTTLGDPRRKKNARRLLKSLSYSTLLTSRCSVHVFSCFIHKQKQTNYSRIRLTSSLFINVDQPQDLHRTLTMLSLSVPSAVGPYSHLECIASLDVLTIMMNKMNGY